MKSFLKIIASGFVGLPMLALTTIAQANPDSSLPLPEQQQPPVTTITLNDRPIDIKLINQTNTVITYQVVGDTKQRMLSGDSDTTLRQLNAPITITIGRPDGGLLQVQPQVSQAGILEVRMDETETFGKDSNSIVVDRDGSVFLN